METEAEKRLRRCCFTGNRPEKMPWSEAQVCYALERSIRKALADGFHVFISGMARGTDIWAAETVLKIKREREEIRLICAIPFQGFEVDWCDEWRDRYTAVLKNADHVRYISAGYTRACFQARNEWMVDHASRVIAVWNGQPSGTKNTIDYAVKSRIDISFVVPERVIPLP